MEAEKQRVASMRRMQIESEQFRYFEDQLRRQELASQRGGEVGPTVTSLADFSSGPTTTNELALATLLTLVPVAK